MLEGRNQAACKEVIVSGEEFVEVEEAVRGADGMKGNSTDITGA